MMSMMEPKRCKRQETTLSSFTGEFSLCVGSKVYKQTLVMQVYYCKSGCNLYYALSRRGIHSIKPYSVCMYLQSLTSLSISRLCLSLSLVASALQHSVTSKQPYLKSLNKRNERALKSTRLRSFRALKRSLAFRLSI